MLEFRTEETSSPPESAFRKQKQYDKLPIEYILHMCTTRFNFHYVYHCPQQENKTAHSFLKILHVFPAIWLIRDFLKTFFFISNCKLSSIWKHVGYVICTLTLLVMWLAVFLTTFWKNGSWGCGDYHWQLVRVGVWKAQTGNNGPCLWDSFSCKIFSF